MNAKMPAILGPVLILALFAAPGRASTVLYTFGGDFVSPGATGAPDSLNSMDPASAGSVTNVLTPVGNGNIGFNGGLVFANSLLYSIGNDSNGFATLYSLQTNGSKLTAVNSDFNNSGSASGIVFQNGLAASGSTFYAVGAGTSGESLYQIGSGSATAIQSLNTLGGTYSGLAWDAGRAVFYAIVAGANGDGFDGDYLVDFPIGGSVQVLANLTSLDGAPVGTHLGGLADAGGGVLFDIYTNANTFTGELERIQFGGSVSAATLYDTQIALTQNAGIAIGATPVPEPATLGMIGVGLTLVSIALRRRKKVPPVTQSTQIDNLRRIQ